MPTVPTPRTTPWWSSCENACLSWCGKISGSNPALSNDWSGASYAISYNGGSMDSHRDYYGTIQFTTQLQSNSNENINLNIEICHKKNIVLREITKYILEYVGL